MTPDASVLLHERRGSWHKLTLNRPDRLNSFNAEMHEALAQALQEIVSDRHARAVLLTGAGRAFCAGQDLGERAVAPDGAPPDLGESLRTRYNPMLRTLFDMPIPTVCAVNGVAAGAGANLALTCDLVLAARSAKFIQAFCNLGLVPDSGGTWLLPRLVGSARARALMLLGEPVSAAEAAEWGMIYRCTADDELQTEAEALVENLAQGPTLGYRLTKRALRESMAHSFEQQLETEAALQTEAGRSADYAEGVAAFGEKRRPVFRGE